MGLFSKKSPPDKAEPKPDTSQAAAVPEAGATEESATSKDGRDWLIPADVHEQLRTMFGRMRDPVTLELVLGQPDRADYDDFVRRFAGDAALLAPEGKIDVRVTQLDSDRAKELEVDRSPVVVFNPQTHHIRYLGAPAGEEGRFFIETIMHMSLNQSGLTGTAKAILEELREERDVTVFVAPTCPYCPQQAMNAVHAAVAKPDLVHVRVVETGENQDLAEAHHVGSVPHTVINDKLELFGLEPEERFIIELVMLKDAETIIREQGIVPGHSHAHDHDHELTSVDLVIVGGGPAGLSAAIYAARAGLTCVVLEKKNVGGQVAVTPHVENYPGFLSVTGAKLVEILAQHARQYVEVREFAPVQEIKIGRRIEVLTAHGGYAARAVILATGATWKKLGVPGEERLFGRGVSYCATCDAYLFKGRKVAVVGGGNTALTDALYLKNVGAEPFLVHRRDSFRGQAYLEESIARESIEVLWNTVVEEVLGQDAVSGVRVRDVVSGETRAIEVSAVFVAIGEVPNSELAVAVGLSSDEWGDISVDDRQRTNIPRVYAAGDVTGGVRQIVTAVSQGAVAAMTAFEDLEKLKQTERREQAMVAAAAGGFGRENERPRPEETDTEPEPEATGEAPKE